MMNRVCARCGEKIRLVDLDASKLVFSVGYKTMFPVDQTIGKVWRNIDLCIPCQEDLRKEFYKRGLLSDVHDKA